jgi:protoporphyrinogen oxidase
MRRKTAVIIGAGPAGLTAAYELLQRTDILPIILESSGQIGGISRTVLHHGNRIDLGGHRLFSRSDKVIRWWLDKLPLQGAPSKDDLRLGRTVPLSKIPGAPDPEKTDAVMLVRRRISRIFAFGKFFFYPLATHLRSLVRLGPARLFRILISYLHARLRPVRPEKTLEAFFINRFGRELYKTFFKEYTQKVWGISCDQIDAAWGKQRVKGVSIAAVLAHAVKSVFSLGSAFGPQKGVETSLIGQFMYPKYGPGQLWEEVARRIRDKGGEIRFGHEVVGIKQSGQTILAVDVRNKATGDRLTINADYCISSMPLRDMIAALGEDVPRDVKAVANGLPYRSIVTVGMLLGRLKVKNDTMVKTVHNIIPDNWIYIQDNTVRLGRVQVANNWSPYLVRDEEKVWLGLEYFCDEGDGFWNKRDEEITGFAARELAAIGFIYGAEDILDSVVIRVPKAYPAYFGTYDRLQTVRDYTDLCKNLFLVGRNGMHQYNNIDHSMLTAMAAVDNIVNHATAKDNLWSIHAEESYQEEE